MLESKPGEEDVCERVIPFGHIELMFHYRQPFATVYPTGETLGQPRSLVSGMSSRWFDAVTCGLSGVLAVAFYPYSANRFFRFPLSRFEGKSWSLCEVAGYEAEAVEQRLSEAVSHSERVAVVEQFLLSRLHSANDSGYRLIRHVMNRIEQCRAQITVASLASEAGLSPRSLERKFSAMVGHSPKQYLRVARFLSAVADLSRIQHEPLVQLAYSNGYFDQAHFIRDFTEFSGYTPTAFLNACCQPVTAQPAVLPCDDR